MKRLLLPAALLLAACHHATQITPVFGISKDQSYIDVAPDSKLRVITPLTKSGSFRVGTAAPTPAASPGTPIEMHVTPDFLGYETSWYIFRAGRGVEFLSAEATIDGKTESRSTQKASLFEETRKARFLRLVFLTRSSSADHDMAVLTARRFADLEPRTTALKQDPEHGCTQTNECSWIPAGIAVRVQP